MKSAPARQILGAGFGHCADFLAGVPFCAARPSDRGCRESGQDYVLPGWGKAISSVISVHWGTDIDRDKETNSPFC